MKQKNKSQIFNRNITLFPIARCLSWDYLFFYTTHFLFLTQVKCISAANVVLIDSFYALFGIVMQVPAAFIVEWLGRKKSIVFANLLNCFYMIIVITSVNLFNLIIAEMVSSLAFGIKECAEPALLNESIGSSNKKDEIFSKVNEKGIANWYILNSITTVLAGFFYDVNPYIPISLSLTINIIVTIISVGFIEPVHKKNAEQIAKFEQVKDLKESFKFILKSERLKSLILFSAVAFGLTSVLTNYEVSLLEELNLDAKYLCLIFAIIGVLSGLASKKQEDFHNKYRNRSLQALLFVLSLTVLLSGLLGIIANTYISFIVLIIISFIVGNCCKSLLQILTDRYLRNFANEEIDTKIFVANNFFTSVFSCLLGLIASFLLERLNTAYSMTIFGALAVIVTYFLGIYMKTRVGLQPDKYSKEEIKYDELKAKSK